MFTVASDFELSGSSRETFLNSVAASPDGSSKVYATGDTSPYGTTVAYSS